VNGVCAIVVAFEAERLLPSCLVALEEALAEHGGRIVVVDNGSTDGSCELVRARFPAVELIELGANRGFPDAVNAGVAWCEEEWVLLVNPDMRLAPDAVTPMLRAARSASDVGAVSAEVRFASEPSVINSAGIAIDRLGVAYDLGLGARAAAETPAVEEVFGVSAGAALYRRSMLEDIDGFDASFFLYLEDVDVAWRARARGWRALCAHEAIAFHEHSATTRHGSSSKLFHVGRNRVRLLAKNADRKQLVRLALAMVVYDLAYVLHVAVTRRELAPLRGRLVGLREWRSYRRRHEPGARVALAPSRGLRAALERNRAWSRYSATRGAGFSNAAAISPKRSAPRSAE
jgi:GT2 family glycosyltransferase